MDQDSLLFRFRMPIVVGLSILGALGLGILLSKFQLLSPYKVEVVNPTPVPSASVVPKSLTVDVSGEVVSPGVYEFDSGSRVGDAINAAGGISKLADTDWVEKNVNKAAALIDGQKIYIPGKSNNQSGAATANKVAGVSNVSNPTPNSVTKTVNINQASQKDLEELWGIGPVTAQKIIDNRPYSSVNELLTKKIVKKNVYDKIFSQLSAF